jgi:hypothetical protein
MDVRAFDKIDFPELLEHFCWLLKCWFMQKLG